jgi:hypothetical protein
MMPPGHSARRAGIGAEDRGGTESGDAQDSGIADREEIGMVTPPSYDACDGL